MMTTTTDRACKRRHPLAGRSGGLLFIVIGCVFLVQQFHWRADLDIVHLWPVIPLSFGAIHLFFPTDEGIGGGVAGFVVGVLFLLHNYHVASIRQTWPVFIVAAGVGILAEAWSRARRARESEHVD